jgi:hypothetical protein
VTEASFEAATVSSPYVFMPTGQYSKWFMFLEAAPAENQQRSIITVMTSSNQVCVVNDD